MNNVPSRLMQLAVVMVVAASAAAVPPKVVSVEPAHGRIDVDPNTNTIKVVFDQDMSTSGHSICGGGDDFPKLTGKLQWTDARTLVMNVRLEKGHDYSFSVNCPSASNCRSITGEAAEPYFVSFRTSGTGPMDEPVVSREVSAAAAGELRRVVKECYSYYELRKVDWDKLFDEKMAALKDANSQREFATIAAGILANAKDKHIRVAAGDTRFRVYSSPVRPNGDMRQLPRAVPGFRKVNSLVYTGRFPDRIGYIMIDQWDNERAEQLNELYAALWEMSDAPGLIIDVRWNGGGSEPLAQKFAGCFISEARVYAKHVYRDVSQPGGFGPQRERVVQPNKHRPAYRGRVAVLVGPVVMSSCESFVMMMQQVPGCKLVGAKTQGSSGNPKGHELGNGVTVYLPSWKDLRLDGTCIEGEGIEPDIRVGTTPDPNGNDPVIEAALSYLRKKD